MYRPEYRLLTLAWALMTPTGGVLDAQEAGRLREPLPLEVAMSVHDHHSSFPIGLSPDGEWIAHTIQTDDFMEADSMSFYYGPTGFVTLTGNLRTEATLTNTRTGETVRLAGTGSASWAPVWSPDGSQVAFYSDEGGEAGIWIWDRATRASTRFPGVAARPGYGFEVARWTRDGERLLVKILPEGRTIAEANAMGPNWKTARASFPVVGPGEPSVSVRSAGPKEAGAAARPDSGSAITVVGDPRGGHADLVLLDLPTRRVTRLVHDAPVRWYALSPDERRVAYSVVKGAEANASQMIYDLMVVDAWGGRPRRLAENVRMGFGNEWSWSPDGRTIAYTESGQVGRGDIVMVSVDDGAVRVLDDGGLPRFSLGMGDSAPLWHASGRYLYAVGDGELWRVDARSGRGSALGRIPGWEIRTVVQPFGRPVIWAADRGQTLWVAARERNGGRSGLFAIDRESGRVRPGLQEAKSYSGGFSLAVSERTGEIVFVSTDQQHLNDIWLFETGTRHVRQVTHINPEVERYALGESRLIEWMGPEGKVLRGALLLPPGYREGQRLPTVLVVYGGEMGSRHVNRFGFWGDIPVFNFHVLATRGYAVLYPDVPVRTGQTMRDIYEGVTSAADAAVAQGYADPERLAIMGQSYGSFSTLAVITQTPRFKAAVITAAVLHPDLFADYLRHPGYYEAGQGNMGGSIWEYPERYRDNSPLFHFDRIETPLLIGQGEKDGLDLVPSEAIFTALERLGKTVEYRVYEGEEHVLMEKPSVLDFWKRRLEFLAEHLKLETDASGRVAAF